MEFRILGPLEVEENGRSLAPGGRKARALLAVLLIHANESLSADRLVEEVWGDELPENAAKTLQIHVSRLRKTLGAERLRTTPGGGYHLVVRPDELDRDRAAALVQRGTRLLEEGEAPVAGSTFAEARALFRGRPLEELADEGFAHGEIARLDELRLTADEGYADAQIAQGRGARVVSDLESLVAANPLRERLREQLMVALYQAGRQADALAVYAEARRTFADELGLEPGPALRELERRILNHDPELGPQGLMLRRPGSSRRRVPLRWAALAAAVAAAAAVAVAWPSSRPDTTLPPRSVGLLHPETLEVRAVVPLGATPSDIAIGRRAVFVGLSSRRSVVVLEPATHASATVGTAVRPGRLAAGSNGLWILDPRSRSVALLGSDRVYPIGIAPARGPGAPLDAIAAGQRSVWVAERAAEILFRLDPTTGRSMHVENRGRDSFFEGDARRAAAVGAGSLWVSNPVSDFSGTDRLGRVSRVDLDTNAVTARIRVPAPPVAIAADANAVWVALERGSDLWRIDPHDEVAVAAVRLDDRIVDLAVGEGAVWALGADGTVSRVDPTTNSVTVTVHVGRGAAIVAGHGAVWVTTR